MNEPATTNPNAVQRASTRILPPLLARAVREADIDWTARVVLVDTPMTPEAYRGLEGTITEVEAALQPASLEQRMVHLASLLTVFPMQDLGEGGNDRRWDVYHKALGDMPADILEFGCEQVAKASTFFPKPVEIRQAAMPRWERRITVLTNLKALRDMKVQVRETSQPEPTPEERQRVRSLLANAFKGMDQA